MDILSDLGLDPHTVVLVFVLGTAVTFALYYRFVINIFDQLWFFMITMAACNILVFALPWKPVLKIEYTFFVLSFWLGFAMRGKISKVESKIEASAKSLLSLELVLIMLFLLLLSANLYVGFTAGFPLFTSNPDSAKVTVYQDGFGIVKRLNMMPFTFFVAGCTVLAIMGYKRTRFVLLLGIGAMLIALTGGKSALLPLAAIPGFAIAHPGLIRGRKKLAERIRRYAFGAFLLAAGLAILILFIDAARGGLGGALQLLTVRILFSGDVILYYFPSRGMNPDLMNLMPIDYLSYLFKGMLATLRILREYPPALGSLIMGTDKVGYGPNPLYFVRADIFFGPIVGCAYCMLLGYITSLLRRLFFTPLTVSVGSLAVRLCFATSAFTLASDSGEFVGGAVDLLLLIGPLWLLAKLMIQAVEGRAIAGEPRVEQA